MTEAGTKRPVVNCAADLQHQVGGSPRPAHLLRLVHPTIDQEIRRAFRHRSPDTHAGAVSSGVVDQPGALAAEIFVDLVKRMPQFSGCHASGSMTALTLVETHEPADAIEGLLGIFGLAVPDAPVHPLDLCDDRDLGLLASRFVGEQSACRQFRVLQPHGDVEPVCDRSRGDAGVGKNRSQPGTAVGERSHLCGSGSADRLKAAVNLNRNVGVGSGDGTKDLPAAVGCLDVANANFQMPLTFLATTNECRVRSDGDAHGCRYRLGCRDVTKLPADLERMGAQCLGAHANIRRQKMRQHLGGDAKGRQGGEMGAQPIQLRRRSTMRWPSDTALDVAEADATKPRQLCRHLAERCCEQMASPAVDVTPIATIRTLRPPSREVSRLRSDNRLLHARQKLLRLGQRQPQIGYVAGPIGPADLHYVYASHPAGHARLDQSQYPTH